MSAEILDDGTGVVTLKVAGKLSEPELLDAQRRLRAILSARGKASLLVLCQQFTGWERGGKWNDFSFQEKADASIEKMAIVGDARLKDDVLMFVAKGLRPFPIEYFGPGSEAKARAWWAPPKR